jgi:putative transposase
MAKLHLRGDYDPQKMAVLTFAECKHVIEKWMLDVYAQREHKTLRVSPWHQWQQGRLVIEPELPESMESLRRRIGIVCERKLQKNGLTENGARYSSNELQAVADAYGVGVSLRFLFDPENLGEIHVWRPDEDEPFTVPAVDPAMKGRTLYQQQLILQEMNANGEVRSDERCAQRALGAILQATTDLLVSRKQRDRSKAARLIGMSSSKAHQEAADYLERMRSVVASPKRPDKEVAVKNLPAALEAFEMKPAGRGRGG